MQCLPFVVIAFAVLVAADEEWTPITSSSDINKIHRNCLKESMVTKEQIAKINRMEHPDETEIHEYILCKVKTIGTFSEAEGYNADRITAILTASNSVDQAQEVITKCLDGNDQQSSPAERAYRGYVCMVATRMDQVRRSLESVGDNDED